MCNKTKKKEKKINDTNLVSKRIERYTRTIHKDDSSIDEVR